MGQFKYIFLSVHKLAATTAAAVPQKKISSHIQKQNHVADFNCRKTEDEITKQNQPQIS